jgi:hypothetical protein
MRILRWFSQQYIFTKQAMELISVFARFEEMLSDQDRALPWQGRALRSRLQKSRSKKVSGSITST